MVIFLQLLLGATLSSFHSNFKNNSSQEQRSVAENTRLRSENKQLNPLVWSGKWEAICNETAVYGASGRVFFLFFFLLLRVKEMVEELHKSCKVDWELFVLQLRN